MKFLAEVIQKSHTQLCTTENTDTEITLVFGCVNIIIIMHILYPCEYHIMTHSMTFSAYICIPSHCTFHPLLPGQFSSFLTCQFRLDNPVSPEPSVV